MMMRYRIMCLLILFQMLMLGCSTYPPVINEQTGLYEGVSTISKDALRKWDTNVDISKFKSVLLIIDTSFDPQTDVLWRQKRLEYLIKEDLVSMGFIKVFDVAQLKELALSVPTLASIESMNLSDQKRISDALGPILLVEFTVRWINFPPRDAYEVLLFPEAGRHYYSLYVTDLSDNNRSYLGVLGRKKIMINMDTGLYYPLLNELRRWVKECSVYKQRQ